MREFWFASGGFAGGFVVCWLFVAKLKADLATVHSKLDVVIHSVIGKPKP